MYFVKIVIENFRHFVKKFNKKVYPFDSPLIYWNVGVSKKVKIFLPCFNDFLFFSMFFVKFKINSI